VKHDAVRRKKPMAAFHAEFRQRLEQACDGATQVPPPNYGRLTWFAEQFKTRFDQDIASESVRKWFAGENKPRDLTMTRLAEILGVDAAWLSLGAAPQMSAKEQRVRNTSADGMATSWPDGWQSMVVCPRFRQRVTNGLRTLKLIFTRSCVGRNTPSTSRSGAERGLSGISRSRSGRWTRPSSSALCQEKALASRLSKLTAADWQM
jgi:hypothetical protein